MLNLVGTDLCLLINIIEYIEYIEFPVKKKEVSSPLFSYLGLLFGYK